MIRQAAGLGEQSSSAFINRVLERLFAIARIAQTLALRTEDFLVC